MLVKGFRIALHYLFAIHLCVAVLKIVYVTIYLLSRISCYLWRITPVNDLGKNIQEPREIIITGYNRSGAGYSFVICFLEKPRELYIKGDEVLGLLPSMH